MAAIAIAAVGLVSTSALSLSRAYTMDYLVYNYLRHYPLMLFPEAFITGMLMTIFVLYRPQWVSTFGDNRNLRNLLKCCRAGAVRRPGWRIYVSVVREPAGEVGSW